MNLSEKDIAGDVLTMAKHGVIDLTWAALECSNPRLRNTLRQMRDQSEKAQEKMAQIASGHRWYLPSEPVDHRSVARVQSHYAEGGVGAEAGVRYAGHPAGPYAAPPGSIEYRPHGPGPGEFHPPGPGEFRTGPGEYRPHGPGEFRGGPGEHRGPGPVGGYQPGPAPGGYRDPRAPLD